MKLEPLYPDHPFFLPEGYKLLGRGPETTITFPANDPAQVIVVGFFKKPRSKDEVLHSKHICGTFGVWVRTTSPHCVYACRQEYHESLKGKFIPC